MACILWDGGLSREVRAPAGFPNSRAFHNPKRQRGIFERSDEYDVLQSVHACCRLRQSRFALADASGSDFRNRSQLQGAPLLAIIASASGFATRRDERDRRRRNSRPETKFEFTI
jgi:hypothetical protein